MWRNAWHVVLVLAVFVVLVGLGFWQRGRYMQKVEWQRAITKARSLPPLNSEALKNGSWRPFMSLRISGQWQGSKVFFLSGQLHGEWAGYSVVTPLQWSANEPWILVDRGWVASPDGQHPPSIAAIAGHQELTGKIYRPVGRRFFLGKWRLNPQQLPPVVQDWDFQRLQAMLHHSVYPFVLRMDPGQPGGFLRQWSWAVLSPQRHFSYMIQWWAFALVWIVGAIIWVRLKVREKKGG